MDEWLTSEIQHITKISDNLEHQLSKSLNGYTIFLKIVYLKGLYTIHKTFQNNYDGEIELKKYINSLDTEEKIKEYFKL